jgi:hypothetical protein
MTKRLDLILNGKGGVGKSFFAVNFVQYLKDKNIPFIACDCDNENSTLQRFHAQAEFLDLAHPRGLDAMFRLLEKNDLVLVDCRAASTEVFFNYFDEINLPAALQNLSAALTVITPINHETDSVEQLQRIVGRLNRLCSYVVLRNQVHSDSFTLYDGCEFHDRLLKELGAREITMTRLQPWLVEELSKTSLTITAALAGGQPYFLDRQRLQTWQRKLYTQIDSVAGLILPVKP